MNKPEPFRFRLWCTVLVWNVVALAALTVYLAYAAGIAAMGAPTRVTQLDRAGVIDETKLRESHPILAANPRRDLGMWIAEKERNSAYVAAGMGATVAAVNVLLVLGLRRPKEKPAIGETGNSGDRGSADSLPTCGRD